MCGLGGILALSEIVPGQLPAISKSLRHRGPDDEGYVALSRDGAYERFRGDDTVLELRDRPHWGSANGHYAVAMCHRRLSILDLSQAGHQPMISDDGDLALVFNGELYNYLELADALEALGWRLRPCGDSAVLLAAFRQWGPSCVDRFRGMWAFAVYDRRQARLTLSRDRFGIKPLYYARSGDALVFASEIKGVLAALPGDPRGSVAEVVKLLTWGGGMDQDEATLFEDVRAVPPGCNLHVSGVDLATTQERYYNVGGSSESFEGSLDEAVEEYRSRFAEAIRLHMRSDVRVGACLSGGLDSNLIVEAAASELAVGRLPTFTAVYDDPSVDERHYVELHATRSELIDPSFTSPNADGLLAEMDDLVRAQDQPLASSSPYAQWAVMRLAADHGMKVLLDGQGADEAIGGYSYFAGAYLLELIRARRLTHAAGEARRLRDRRGIGVLREIGRAAFPRLPSVVRRRMRDRARVGGGLVMPDFRGLGVEPSRPGPRTYRDTCLHALRHNLPQLLRYEDRSSMAFSIESRVPFLDHPLVELVLSLPTDMKVNQGWTKLVQRKAAEGRLPDKIVWRRDKLGFATPQQAWQRATSTAVGDFVRQAEIPAFLDRGQIQALTTSGLASPAARSEYWQAIFLLRWMHVFRVRFG